MSFIRLSLTISEMFSPQVLYYAELQASQHFVFSLLNFFISRS